MNTKILNDMFNYNTHVEKEIKELHNSKRDLKQNLKISNEETKTLKVQINELNDIINQQHNDDNEQLKKELRKNRKN